MKTIERHFDYTIYGLTETCSVYYNMPDDYRLQEGEVLGTTYYTSNECNSININNIDIAFDNLKQRGTICREISIRKSVRYYYFFNPDDDYRKLDNDTVVEYMNYKECALKTKESLERAVSKMLLELST